MQFECCPTQYLQPPSESEKGPFDNIARHKKSPVLPAPQHRPPHQEWLLVPAIFPSTPIGKQRTSTDRCFAENNSLTSIPKTETKNKKILPGSSQPQDLGTITYKDMTTNAETQVVQSIDSTKTVVTEIFQLEEKILPEGTPEQQYEFATSFLKVGDYNMAERAFKEFVDKNPKNKLSGNAQYWYAETFRIRQLYTDAASAYLEGYQNYPKSEKAPINLLKLGVSLVQIGEKDQGCLMITGVQKQYPDANQSVLQKSKYEEKKFECKKDNS